MAKKKVTGTLKVQIEKDEILVKRRFDLIGRSLTLAMKELGTKLEFATRIEGADIVFEITKLE